MINSHTQTFPGRLFPPLLLQILGEGERERGERERERELASDGIHTAIDAITLTCTVGCQKIMATNTQRAVYKALLNSSTDKNVPLSLSLSQKRQRWCASFSFRVICTREPLAILEMVGPHDRDT